MKRKAPWFGAGMAALILTAGCAHAPLRQVAKTSAIPAPDMSEPTPAWRRADTATISKPSTTSGMLSATAKPDEMQSSAWQDPAAIRKAAPSTTGPVPYMSPARDNSVKDVLSHSIPQSKADMIAPGVKKPEVSSSAAAPTLAGKLVEKTKLSDAAPALRQTKWETGNLVDPPVLERVAAKTSVKEARPVQARMGHAPDYGWLCGELEYSRYHRNWRVRYAGLDEIDPYGGSVTLADDVRTAGLKDGQHVRVEGRLANPVERAIAPVYEVTSIQMLDK